MMNPTADQLRQKGFVEVAPGQMMKFKAELVPQTLIKPQPAKRIRQDSKPVMNKTEARYMARLIGRGFAAILAQSVTLRLDPPYKSYRPDFLALSDDGLWIFFEVKAMHRFAEKGIAKAALAAKTYPAFTFTLALWNGKEWEESILSS